MKLYGTTSAAHPTWGNSGRPILLGDRAVHQEIGSGNVKAITDFKVTFKDAKHGARHTVSVGELFIEVEQMPELVRGIREGL